MKCEKAQEFFSEYMEGNLERPMAFTLEHHLKECSACEHDYERFRRTWDALESLPEVEVPSGFRASVMEKIAAQQESRKRSFWSLDLVSILHAKRAIAATAAVGLLAVMIGFTRMSPSPTTEAGPGVGIPSTITIDKNGDVESLLNKELETGLDVAVSGTSHRSNIIYTFSFKPLDGARGKVEAFLMGQDAPAFSTQALKSAGLLFRESLSGEQSRNTTLVVNKDDRPQVVYVQWKYSNPLPEMTAVFLPSHLTTSRTAETSFSVPSMPLHQALQKLSETYGVVVMADCRENGTVDAINLTGSVDQAFSAVLKNQDLRASYVANNNVFVVQEK